MVGLNNRDLFLTVLEVSTSGCWHGQVLGEGTLSGLQKAGCLLTVASPGDWQDSVCALASWSFYTGTNP